MQRQAQTIDFLKIVVSKQVMLAYSNDELIKEYVISTAKNGMGELINSHQTPRGWHCIRAKIGTGKGINTIFVGRRPTGEIYSPELVALYPGRDWILTRILWLSGLEKGKNRLGDVDTMRRYIYIHGTSDESRLGQPCSHGCIRMRNRDIMEMFELVAIGTRVFIG